MTTGRWLPGAGGGGLAGSGTQPLHSSSSACVPLAYSTVTNRPEPTLPPPTTPPTVAVRAADDPAAAARPAPTTAAADGADTDAAAPAAAGPAAAPGAVVEKSTWPLAGDGGGGGAAAGATSHQLFPSSSRASSLVDAVSRWLVPLYECTVTPPPKAWGMSASYGSVRGR